MAAGRQPKTFALLTLTASVGAVLVSLTGCSSSSDQPTDQDQIRDVTKQVTEAYTAKDVDRWAAGLCAQTAEKVRATKLEENQPGMKLVSIDSITVDADKATAMVTVDKGGQNATEKVGYVRENGDWKFCTQEK
ncbi:hypothetical protein FK531_02195 [Rhodococcus spelaei]|uniref:DUF4878 domain-containing protein n=1 Tax=Rhodococcus spelaei TaxID=2546320 RepID=A0A541BRI0_9NOCA|nr:hypothetical protein [Rhodococcus spelaei]TQF74898.1 hypothetical protein FK531_02195 [Rhodococcus spelaei]